MPQSRKVDIFLILTFLPILEKIIFQNQNPVTLTFLAVRYGEVIYIHYWFENEIPKLYGRLKVKKCHFSHLYLSVSHV